MSGHRPPRWLERILERTLPSGLAGQGPLGDLAEGFERRALTSPLRARLWYASQTISIVTYRILTGEGIPSTNSSILMDVRWTLRSILRNPGFSLGVVAALGLGLGANAAVFSVVDGTFQNTSWWQDVNSTVAVRPGKQFSRGELQMYTDYQKVYTALGGYSETAFALGLPDGESVSVNGVMISPALFRELAVQPVLGRAFVDDDAIVGLEPVVVLGDALWQRSFGADPAIVGSRVDLYGVPVTVVGIQGPGAMAPGGRAEVWVPLVSDPRDEDYWLSRDVNVVGVLRGSADLDDALTDIVGHGTNLESIFPNFYESGFGERFGAVARADESQRKLISTPLLLLLGGTALLLLVTALNVGNLLLGRAIERRRELAVRTALGAGRGRIVRQLLVEGIVWTGLGLAIGMVAASFAGTWIADLFVDEAVVASSRMTSPAVLGFSAAVALLSWLVLSGVPIAHYLRSQRHGLTLTHSSGHGAQRMLVTAQAALATLLLVSATLLVATVANLRKVPLGFETDNILTVELSPPEDRVADLDRARGLYDGLVTRVEGLPGVTAAGLTAYLPLREQAPSLPINLEAAPVRPVNSVKAPKHWVDPGFFAAMGVRPTAGRVLNSDDRADSPSAVVVNESLAKLLWPDPDQSPVGQRIAIDPHAWDTWVPVVGVIPDLRSGDMVGPAGPAMYVALAEGPTPKVTLVIRTISGSDAIVPMVRKAVSEVDPLVPIRSIMWMDSVAKASYSTAWVMMGLLIVLAVLATGLGAVGIYAVLAHHVALSKREIGVRMALGAKPSALIGSIVRSGMILAGVGILLGSVGAALSTRALDSLLFGVSALAPWAFVGPALLLLSAAGLAALIPAVRAGRLPPAEVLRGE